MRLLLAILSLSLQGVIAAEWELTWQDEFNTTDGTQPSADRWVYDLGGNGWGNAELQTYTERTENCRIENGILIIEARKEEFSGKDKRSRAYTSARLKTKGKSAWLYGRFEARLKLPFGQGIWPAFWMLGADSDRAGWPRCGEIDIMENIGREPSTVHGTVHGPGYSGGKGIGKPFALKDGKKFADDFHVFALEWTTNKLQWFVDDQEYFTLTPANLPAGAKWVFDKPEFILLNLAAGGNWPGLPNDSTTFPQRFLIDYVRVYRRAGAP